MLSSLFLLLTGCAALDKSYEEPKHIGPLEQVFFAPYDQVWRATQLAIARYPMRINNMDTGLLETDLIGGANAWHPPGSKTKIPNAQAYILRVQVIKGRSLHEKAVKVVVEKIIRIKSNFFADARPVPSDGLEEKIVLYRTGRILTIERALEAALNQSNEQSNNGSQGTGQEQESSEPDEDY